MASVPAVVSALVLAADPYAAQRERMVREQIEARGVRDAALLRVLRATPRHLFVAREKAAEAYDDHPVPIGFGATVSQPYIVAAMTELLAVTPSHRVLEIGTGSGYQAAVLAQLCRHVYSVEIVRPLADAAAKRLAAFGYGNVTVKAGDGYLGWPEEAPFDRIIVTAAPAEIPEALVAQLARGGRLVIPAGGSFSQSLYVIDKARDGTVRKRAVFGVMFVPMIKDPQAARE